VPPPGAPVGVVFDRPLDGDPVVRLPDRITVGGRLRDAAGQPLGGVQVTVRPSLRFAWSLEGRGQEFVTAIPAATVVTTPEGDYAAFVDPFLADEVGDNDVWGFYDITVEESANTPAWALFDFEIARDTDIVKHEVEDIVVPDAAHIHGHITDASGVLIEGAELKLFRAASAAAQLCTLVQHAPPSCPIPAQLLGRGASDVSGEFRLTLPR
jgi:hypothetical protein